MAAARRMVVVGVKKRKQGEQNGVEQDGKKIER